MRVSGASEAFSHASSARRLWVGTITVRIVGLTTIVRMARIVYFTDTNAAPSIGVPTSIVIGAVIRAVRILGTVAVGAIAVVRVARIAGTVAVIRRLPTV